MKVSEEYNMGIEDLLLVSVELKEKFFDDSKPYWRVVRVDCKQTYDPLLESSGYHPLTTQIRK